MNRLDRIEQGLKTKGIPAFKVGDTIRVFVKGLEGEKERIQVFEGAVIGRKGGGHRETITVRKLSYGVGVERIFPIHGPLIAKIEVVQQGRVRRAKLYYLRARKGKAAKIAERGFTSGVAADEAAPPVSEPEPETVEAETS